MVRQRSPGGMSGLGLHPVEARMGAVGAGGGTGSSADYATFVETRIEDLARSARRDGVEGPPVQRQWAVPELVALGVSALAFVASLLVL